MQVGSIVQLKGKTKENAKITRFLGNIAELDRTLDGYTAYHISRLENADHRSLPDFNGHTWHLMRREDGSICLYWTEDGNPAHNVVWDSLEE